MICAARTRTRRPPPPSRDARASASARCARWRRPPASAPRSTSPWAEDVTPLAELIAGSDGSEVSRPSETADTRRGLWAMLRLLPARHRDVLLRRYGLIGDRAHSHHEIAA